MKSKISTVVAAAVLAGASLGAIQADSASATGQYTYQCISTAGTAYLLQPGEALSHCKGSYLQAYISGQMAWSMNLTTAGTPAKGLTKADADCLIAVVGAVVAIYTTKGRAAWVGNAATAWGLTACRA